MGVTFARLREQLSAILKRNDGVYLRIDLLDVVEIRGHDLNAGDSACVNRAGETCSIHHHEIIRVSHGRACLGRRMRDPTDGRGGGQSE